LGHDPAKQILSVTYAQDLSDNLARKSRTLMTSPFYEALFDTRLSKGRELCIGLEHFKSIQSLDRAKYQWLRQPLR
jgi:hypothetical protein